MSGLSSSEYKGGNDMMDKLSGMKSATTGGKRRRSGRRTLGRKYKNKNKNCGKTRRRRTRSRMGGLFD
jgi:hypothetical protein